MHLLVRVIITNYRVCSNKQAQGIMLLCGSKEMQQNALTNCLAERQYQSKVR